jgi:hypothetical protein
LSLLIGNKNKLENLFSLLVHGTMGAPYDIDDTIRLDAPYDIDATVRLGTPYDIGDIASTDYFFGHTYPI